MSGTQPTNGGSYIRGNPAGSGPVLYDQAPPIAQTVDHGSIGAGNTLEATFTMTGVEVADRVQATPQTALQNGLAMAGARVTAADTVGVSLCNHSAAPIDPAPITWLINVIRERAQR